MNKRDKQDLIDFLKLACAPLMGACAALLLWLLLWLADFAGIPM